MVNYDCLQLPCWYCNRDVRYPKKKYRPGLPVFCSTKCNMKFVAERGLQQQQNLRNYGTSTTS